MHDLVKNVKFKKHFSSPIENIMKNHMKEMKRENKFYVAADKTSNFYKVAPEKYKEMINKEIHLIDSWSLPISSNFTVHILILFDLI